MPCKEAAQEEQIRQRDQGWRERSGCGAVQSQAESKISGKEQLDRCGLGRVLVSRPLRNLDKKLVVVLAARVRLLSVEVQPPQLW